MKIINLKAENIKKIKAVDITPTENTVVITGKNGQGKSSVLDSILYALGGKDALKNTPKPIREGQESASIELDLGDYKVVRTWNSLGTTRLEVLSKEGARFGSPQALLDEIVGRIAFDPLAFAGMKPAEQKQVLLDVLGLVEQVEELQNEYQLKYDERRDVGRDLKNAEGHLASMVLPEDAPEKIIDTAEVAKKLEAARENNRLIRDGEAFLETGRKELAKMEAAVEAHKQELKEREAEFKKYKHMDTEKLEEQLNNATNLNAAYQKREEYIGTKKEVETHKKAQEVLTKALEAIVAKKEQLITSAKLPIEGLNIDSEGVTYKGIPFSQLSSAEQLKVSLAIAMAMNPKLRVMRIMDGSLLDSDNMQIIKEMATAEDYQVWIERVEDGDNVGFMLEEGELKK